jgi:PAS domain S-box-containing protein
MKGNDSSLQVFLEAAPDAIVVVDSTGNIVAVNALTEQMFGYAREELLQHGVELLVPARAREQHRFDRAEYSEKPKTRTMGGGRELRGRRRNGEEFVVQISLSPIESESGRLVISIIRDVTDQRAAEARFRALLESAPDGIVVVDERGVIVIINSQTERLFGYTREELIGQRVEVLVPERYRHSHVGDRSAFTEDPKLRPMGAGRPLTGRKKNGEEFPVEISLSPLVTAEGRLVTSIIRDITDRRRAEEIIQASLREKEALLKEIHHRVKNNLQVTSSLLRLQASASGNANVRQMLEEAENRIQSMALVHEKLYQSTNLARIDLADYFRSLGELLSQSFAVDPALVSIQVLGDPTFLAIDLAVPFGLLVNELLSNALKHAFKGGRGRIGIELARHDGSLVVVISDDGVGQLRDLDIGSLETLGLKLVYALVAQIDGRVEIENLQPGTAFRITLPLAGGGVQ